MNPNLIEVFQKAIDSVEYQYQLGGWHQIGIVLIVCMPIVIVALLRMIKELKGEK